MRTKNRYFVRRARTASAGFDTRGLGQAFRNLIISAVVLAVFLFAANLVMKYAAEKMNIPKISIPMPFSRPVFYIIGDNFYTVYSDGKVEMVRDNIDRSALPILSGIMINEKRPKHKKALKEILKIKAGYFENISEISLRNPSEIILITIDGKKVFAGDSLDGEKMKNFALAVKKAKLLGKRYSYVDLRFKDRVIIK